MSTEHQKYSTENQAEIIAQYAARRGFEIVRTYEDAGKSGLRLDGRLSLQTLIADVRSGSADFEAVLVYDVSRWGRFQDADESAYYEFICREAGIKVHYCAEQFENDGSLSATIIKSMKRAMAGEYSRELSAKVFAGQCLSRHLVTPLFALLTLAVQILVPYHRYVWYLKWLTFSLLAYAAVLFTVHVPWGEVVLRTFWPSFNLDADAATMIVAVFGTTISPYLFFWQASEEVEDMRAMPGASPLLNDRAAAPSELRRIA
jgi:hypothetical protein